MRNFCYIQQIERLLSIENADKIEIAKIKGWNIVVEKGVYKPGDTCVYFEIDSFIPESIPFFSFLSKYSHVKTDATGLRGYVIKTVKLRGVVSQGLIVPLDELIDKGLLEYRQYWLEEGVSDQLGIKLYERPENPTLRVQPGGSFPSFIPKTDVDRLQNHIEYFDTLKDMQFEVTEKLDGTSCTIYYWGNDGFSCQGVCSRNYDVSYTENVYTAIEKKYNIIERIKRTARNLAIQGEIVGPGIQNNLYRLTTHAFYVFDIYDIDKKTHLSPVERLEVFHLLNSVDTSPLLQHVPVVFTICHAFKDAFTNMEDALDFAARTLPCSKITPSWTTVEGFVFKSIGLDAKHDRVTFKVINNEYLLNSKFVGLRF